MSGLDLHDTLALAIFVIGLLNELAVRLGHEKKKMLPDGNSAEEERAYQPLEPTGFPGTAEQGLHFVDRLIRPAIWVFGVLFLALLAWVALFSGTVRGLAISVALPVLVVVIVLNRLSLRKEERS